MVLKIRLARFGKRHKPFYNIVLAHARTARNSKPLEVLGTYDPIPKITRENESRPFKDIKLDLQRARYWLGVGAQPSDPAWRLLSMVGLLPPKYRVGQRAGAPVEVKDEELESTRIEQDTTTIRGVRVESQAISEGTPDPAPTKMQESTESAVQ